MSAASECAFFRRLAREACEEIRRRRAHGMPDKPSVTALLYAMAMRRQYAAVARLEAAKAGSR